jgi:hypothetical protein
MKNRAKGIRTLIYAIIIIGGVYWAYTEIYQQPTQEVPALSPRPIGNPLSDDALVADTTKADTTKK